MVINPATIALTSCSLTISLVAIHASLVGIQIIGGWDIKSGHEKQLQLERKTYLISTILNYALACELLSLFLFVSTADRMHPLFIGAMCATGSLNANIFGFAVLILKSVNCLLCGIWIALNYLDNQGYDYPLVRLKYGYLIAITCLLVTETVMLINYLARLAPQIITSCCGTVFNEDADTVAGDLAHLPPFKMMALFYMGIAAVLASGGYFLQTRKRARLFSFVCMVFFLITLASIVSFISLYYYELPTHHCPFCLLQKEYNHIGYPLYLTLFSGAIMGGSLGMIDFFKGFNSLGHVIPTLQKQFCLIAVISYVVLAIIATAPIVFSDFKLGG
ncbi:hypothetical protein DSLASN_43850 [Desulfoluna limicola]|uniref:Uncharacterized protein n=1 Tax=Desulfoluna limicola TaxID=2810562 RepID=A0ABM7PMY0_9BACT|nr:hypothetical protein [Desulfoluna limicola]BCS98753.1 hypothetical protein DSLASN_43850 [Desulfoluna limicola]